MRIIALLALVLLALASSAHAAFAGPLIVAAFAIAGIAIPAWVGSVIAAALLIGASLVMSALRKPEKPASGTSLETRYGGAQPRAAIFGEQATAGHLTYANVYGPENKSLQAVYEIGDGLHDALVSVNYNGVDYELIDRSELPEQFGSIEGVGIVAGWLLRNPNADTGPSGYANVLPGVFVRFFRGEFDQAADPELVTHANPPERWTENHRGRGVCYVSITQAYNEEWGLTGYPTVRFRVRGLRLYDPRFDSTVGGSGPQRWGQPATYAWSGNPAVQEYNFRRGIFIGSHRVLGMGVDASDLILPMFFAAANDCDDDVPRKDDAPEPRYRCHFQVYDNAQHAVALQTIRDSMAGYTLERAGQFGPIAGVPQQPIAELAFTDADALEGTKLEFSKYRTRSDIATAVHGRFCDPNQQFEEVSFPAREDEAKDAAFGERISREVDFTQVQSPSQAQRLAEIYSRRSLLGFGRITLGAKWLAAQPGDWAPFTHSRHGEMAVVITGTTVHTDPNGEHSATITFEVIAASVFSWTTAGELAPPNWGAPGRPGEFTTFAGGMQAHGVVLQGAGNLVRPGVRFTWSSIGDPSVDRVDFEIRKDGEDETVQFSAEYPAGGIAVWTAGAQASTDYEYRHKLKTTPRRSTPWSDWEAVSTPAAHTVPKADEVDAAGIIGQIIADQLADAAVTAQKIAAEAIDATKIAAGLMLQGAGDVLPDPSTYQDSDVFFHRGEGKLYRLVDGEWTATVPAVDIDGQFIADQIADGAITGQKLAAAIIDATKIATGLMLQGAGSALPDPSTYQDSDVFFHRGEGKLYRLVDGAWVATVPAVDITGQLVADQIADAAITAAKLAAGIIDATKIAGGLMLQGAGDTLPNPATYQDSDVFFHRGEGKLYRKVGGQWVATVPAVDIAGQVVAGQIADAAISAAKLAAEAVTNEKIAASTITGAKLVAGTITARELILTDFTNYTQNPYFDAGIAGWGSLPSDWSVESGDGYEGRGSYLRTGAVAVNWANENTFEVAPGDRFLIVGVARREATAPTGSLNFRIQWFNAAGGSIGTNNGAVFSAANAPLTWERRSNSFTPPAGATHARATFNGGAGHYNIAFHGIFRQAAAELIVDGAIIAAKIAVGAVETDKLAANAVTADKIAANTITAGQIQAGAIGADQIAANAINATHILAGSLAAETLAIGFGKNMIPNASFTWGADGWEHANSGGMPGAEVTFATRPVDQSFSGPITPTLMVFQNGTNATGQTDVFVSRPDHTSEWLRRSFPATPGKSYEASAQLSFHRCSGRIYMRFYDIAGAALQTITGALYTDIQGGANPELWTRGVERGVAPTGTAYVACWFRKGGTNASSNSYMFIHKPMLCEAPANATEPTPWSDGGVIMMTGGGIVANAIIAAHISAGAIETNKLAANAVTADKIAANTITAGQIQAGAIGADQIAAEAIRGVHILGNSIATSHLVVTDFTNLLENPGFEIAGGAGWNAGTGNSIGGAGNAYNGAPSFLRLNPGGGPASNNNSAIKVEPGTELLVTAAVKRTVAADGSINFRVRYTLADGNVINGPTLLLTAAATTTSYVVYSSTAASSPAPENVRSAALQIVNNVSAGGMDVGYAGLFRRAAGNLIVDGSITADKVFAGAITGEKIAALTITAGNVAAGTLTGDKIAANTITAGLIQAGAIGADQIAAEAIRGVHILGKSITSEKLVITDYTNLVDNPAFETGVAGGVVAGWSGTITGAGNSIEAGGYNSGFFVRIAGAQNFASMSRARIEPGSEIMGVVVARRSAATTGNVVARLRFLDAAGGIVQSANQNISSNVTNGWTRLAWFATAQPGTATVHIDFVNSLTAQTIDVGFAGIHRRAAGELIVDGSIIAGKIAAGAINVGTIIADEIIVAGHLVVGAATRRATNTHASTGIMTGWTTLVSVTMTVQDGTAVMRYSNSRTRFFWGSKPNPPGAQARTRFLVDGNTHQDFITTQYRVGNSNDYLYDCPLTLMSPVTGLSNGSHTFAVQAEGIGEEYNVGFLEVDSLYR